MGEGRRVSYFEEQWRSKAVCEVRWKITPRLMADRIRIEGVVRVEPVGDASCRQVEDRDRKRRTELDDRRGAQRAGRQIEELSLLSRNRDEAAAHRLRRQELEELAPSRDAADKVGDQAEEAQAVTPLDRTERCCSPFRG